MPLLVGEGARDDQDEIDDHPDACAAKREKLEKTGAHLSNVEPMDTDHAEEQAEEKCGKDLLFAHVALSFMPVTVEILRPRVLSLISHPRTRPGSSHRSGTSVLESIRRGSARGGEVGGFSRWVGTLSDIRSEKPVGFQVTCLFP